MAEDALKVVSLHSDSVPKSLYEDLLRKCELQDKWIGIAVADKLENLEREVISLKRERDTLEGRLTESNKREAEIKREADKRVLDIQKEADKRVAAVEKSHKDGIERQRGVYRSREAELDYDINSLKRDMRSKEKVNDELKRKNEELSKENVRLKTLIESRDEEIERLTRIESKVDGIDEMLEELMKLAERGSVSKKEIEDTVKKNLNNKFDPERDIRAAKLLADGKDKASVSKEVYGSNKVYDKLKKEHFVKLVSYFKGETTEIPDRYKKEFEQ